jgi:hypothetical protein
MTMRDRLPRIREISLELLPELRANVAGGDSNGVSLASVMGRLRDIGVAEFVLSSDVGSFKRNLSEVASIRLNLFERFANGEPIAKSLVAMVSYIELLDGLAAGDFATADRLAELMGGRPDLEKENDHPFDRCLGYTLKSFVQRDAAAMAEWAAKFEEICRSKSNADFMGYARVFKGILASDATEAQAGLLEAVKGHLRQSKHGIFRNNVDSALCVWGIGIANLGRKLGLHVTGVAPLIPDELLC